MSGFDVVIYIAGLILLTKLFMRELIGVVRLGRRLLAAAKDPLPSSRQLEAVNDSHSTSVSDSRSRNSE
jgi:hypothetical protein